jgi:oligosaccharide repeat unit polymerase
MRCGSWFAPAAFVGLLWSFFIGVCLMVVQYPIPGRGLWMLVLLVVGIQMGALIAHELHPPSKTPVSDMSTLNSLIVPCRRYGLLCTTIALTGCVYFLVSSLQEFDLPFTFIGVLEVGARWTMLRLEDAFEPWPVRLLVTWLHPAALLGGILFACSNKRLDRVIGVITLLPAVVYGVLTGARAAILLGLTCWIGGYVTTQCMRHPGGLALFSAKRSIIMLLVATSIVGMFISIDAVRDTYALKSLVFETRESHLSNYLFGSPAAFANWYSHSDVSGAEWGARTFANEFDLLQLKTRIVGRYNEMSNELGTEATNIYTLFRGLIEDFTAFGAILLTACIGGLANWIYSSTGRNPRRAMFWLSAFYSTFLFSPIVSFFSFNGAALAWVVLGFILIRMNRRSAALSLPYLSAPEITGP